MAKKSATWKVLSKHINLLQKGKRPTTGQGASMKLREALKEQVICKISLVKNRYCFQMILRAMKRMIKDLNIQNHL